MVYSPLKGLLKAFGLLDFFFFWLTALIWQLEKSWMLDVLWNNSGTTRCAVYHNMHRIGTTAILNRACSFISIKSRHATCGHWIFLSSKESLLPFSSSGVLNLVRFSSWEHYVLFSRPHCGEKFAKMNPTTLSHFPWYMSFYYTERLSSRKFRQFLPGMFPEV